MSEADKAASYEALKLETAQMLKLTPDKLGLIENLQVDLISLLRLEIDGMEGDVFAGKPVDLDRLSTALGMLQKLLPTQSLVAAPVVPERRSSGARKRLKAMLDRMLEGREQQLAYHPDECRKELEAEIVRAREKYNVLDPAPEKTNNKQPNAPPAEAPSDDVPTLVSEPVERPPPQPPLSESELLKQAISTDGGDRAAKFI